VIKAVIFDYADVISGSVIPYFREMYPHASDEIRSAFIDEFDYGEVDYRGMLDKLAELTGQTAEVVEQNIRDISKNFNNDPRLLSLIKGLREKGYKTGLLSNIGPGFLDMNFPERGEYFDDIVLSYEVHMVKPSPEIYHLAARNLGVEPDECVFVDDSQRNVDGAEAVGMKGIVYKNFDEFLPEISKFI